MLSLLQASPILASGNNQKSSWSDVITGYWKEIIASSLIGALSAQIYNALSGPEADYEGIGEEPSESTDSGTDADDEREYKRKVKRVKSPVTAPVPFGGPCDSGVLTVRPGNRAVTGMDFWARTYGRWNAFDDQPGVQPGLPVVTIPRTPGTLTQTDGVVVDPKEQKRQEGWARVRRHKSTSSFEVLEDDTGSGTH